MKSMFNRFLDPVTLKRSGVNLKQDVTTSLTASMDFIVLDRADLIDRTYLGDQRN